ncbi:MAG: HDOD domain-containing protein [Chitinivibrionales bacterium]|nr:HDOD domain-containing protein [Chitinivibrionales bacterium]
MKTALIEEKLGGIENLPTLPMVLRQIRKVMNNPNSNMSNIAAIVAKDQSLAARTIRLVNSAYYARRTRVPSIQQAIVVLGLTTLHNLMLGLSVVKMFQGSRLLGFNIDEFWQHSFAVALLSKKMASLPGVDIDPEESFIAGLLHDMGRLALQQFLHDDFEKALKQSGANKTSLCSEEKNVFGFDHADAGAWLGRRWDLHEKITGVLEYHHRPFEIPSEYNRHEQLIHIVAYANDICTDESIGNSGQSVVGERKYRGLPPRTDNEMRIKVEETVSEVISVVEEWTQGGRR